MSACLEINGLPKKTSEITGPCEYDPQVSEEVSNPRLFGMGGRIFYLRPLSGIERERLRIVGLDIDQRSGEKPHPTEYLIEMATIFANAAGMSLKELYRCVEIVDTVRVYAVLVKVSGFPTLPDGRTDFASGISSA